MQRQQVITKFISKEERGIEIAPWHNPLLPKRAGYKALTMDIFDSETLRRVAKEDINIPREGLDRIEDVDFVGSATEIDRIVSERIPLGSLDYVVSSHNLEHLPDPIRFLQGCEKILKVGGKISMAIPDRRSCFDFFRPISTLGDWLEAYFQKRQRPTQAQIFIENSLHSRYYVNGQGLPLPGFSIEGDPLMNRPMETLEDAYTAWKSFNEKPDEEYRDTHCWAFTPASFELIIRDLSFLGLINLEVTEISDTVGNEFYAHLTTRKPISVSQPYREEYYRKRADLLFKTVDEGAVNAPCVYRAKLDEAPSLRVAALERDIIALRASTSWRITSPLRKLGTFLKKKTSAKQLARSIAMKIPRIARIVTHRNQLLVENATLKSSLSSLKDQSSFKPVITNEKIGKSILDVYVDTPPNRETELGIFDGTWSSLIPDYGFGNAQLFDDHRIRWFEEKSGGLQGKRILELGPLEGGHTYMLARAGADSITAIESNTNAFLKCLVVQNVLKFKANFLLGDFRPYLETCTETYHLLVASGVLYHMTEPVKLLQDMARVSRSIGLWTHYYDADVIRSHEALNRKFEREPQIENVGSRLVKTYKQSYLNALEWQGFNGGSAPISRWLTRESLLGVLEDIGFKVEIGGEEKDHPNGPCILLFATR